MHKIIQFILLRDGPHRFIRPGGQNGNLLRLGNRIPGIHRVRRIPAPAEQHRYSANNKGQQLKFFHRFSS